jgi:hypothetical protein
MYRHVKPNLNKTASFTNNSVCSRPNTLRNTKRFLRQISLINHFQEKRKIKKVYILNVVTIRLANVSSCIRHHVVCNDLKRAVLDRLTLDQAAASSPR